MHENSPLDKLRRALGDELLVRDGRALVRTPHAEALLPEANALMASARRILAPTADFRPADATGVVTLALGDDMQALLAGPLLERVRTEAPGLDVRVRPLALDSARAAQRGLIDVAVLPDVRGTISSIPELDELVLSPQYTRRFVTVSRRKLTLDLDGFAAADHVLVSPQGDGWGFVDDALKAAGRGRRIAVTLPSFLAAIALVDSTDLVATLPDDVVTGIAPPLHRQPCPVPTPEIPICVAWPARLTRDQRHRWLRGQVIQALQRARRAT